MENNNNQFNDFPFGQPEEPKAQEPVTEQPYQSQPFQSQPVQSPDFSQQSASASQDANPFSQQYQSYQEDTTQTYHDNGSGQNDPFNQQYQSYQEYKNDSFDQGYQNDPFNQGYQNDQYNQGYGYQNDQFNQGGYQNNEGWYQDSPGMKQQAPGHGKAVAALVLAIVGTVCCGPCTIAGFILALLAKKEGNNEGIRTAAFIVSIAGFALWIIALIVGIATGAYSYNNYYNDYY